MFDDHVTLTHADTGKKVLIAPEKVVSAATIGDRTMLTLQGGTNVHVKATTQEIVHQVRTLLIGSTVGDQSFAVNLNHVSYAEETASGLRLHFEGMYLDFAGGDLENLKQGVLVPWR